LVYVVVKLSTKGLDGLGFLKAQKDLMLSSCFLEFLILQNPLLGL
jgi:hypothetical protein